MATLADKKQAAQNAPEVVEEEIKTKFKAYAGSEPYIFISYSHANKDAVYPILDALHDCKFRIWYDDTCEVGNDFRDELRQRIKACDAVIVFVSDESMASKYCSMEIIVAREYGKRLYPIRLNKNVEIPPAFQLLFDISHYVVASDEGRMMESLVRDLPAITMDRLTLDNGRLTKCEDNGSEITVDEGVKVVCAGAFKGRKQLKKVVLPDSLEEIEQEAFRGCNNLEEMNIPAKTTRVGESAFRDCVSLKKLTVENDCIKIGERSFENCATLTDVRLPDGLTELYGGIFNSCKSLKNLKLPENLTVIGESAFSDCVGLEKIVVPGMVTKIDDLVFNGCISMASIELPEGLRKIGKSAFKNCKSLTKVNIPSTVVSISEAPFRGCENMKSIKVEPKNKHYKSEPNKREGKDYVLFNKNKSVIIAYPANSREVVYDIPDSVTVISDWAFCDSRRLSRITMPDSVNEIGEGAFCNCVLLEEIEIPDSVVKIDDCAFRGCTNLRTVIIPDSVKDMGWGVFDGCEDKVTVYCSENSLAEAYCKRNGIKVARPESLLDE